MDKQELMHERKRALKVFKEDLEKNWDKLVEEAKKSLGDDEENYITYRLALLIFALRRMPPANHSDFKYFKKEIRYYI